MKRFLSAAVLAAGIALFASASAQAAAIIQSLPKDGSWAKFHLEITNDRQANQNMLGTMTIRSVGTVMENGEKCRWLEMQMEGEQDGKKQKNVMKFLVRERDLKAGAKGNVSILRGWQKNSLQGDVKELSHDEKAPNGPLSIFFGRTVKSSEKLKKEKVIDYQKGRLRIAEGTKSKLDFAPPGNPNVNLKIKYDVTLTTWPHKSIPFGTAAAGISMQVIVNNNVSLTTTMKLTMEDYGTGAKSALPDKK